MTTETKQAELQETAGRIRAWQEERKISDSQMCRDFAGLGSTKTYTRIVAGDTEELDVDRWQRDYEAVWSLIQVLSESESDDDELYPDLTTVLDVRKAVADVMREKGNSRLVLVQGPSGSGKTTAAQLLRGRYGSRVVLCEATEIWKENMNAMLSAILSEFGVKNPKPSAAGKFETLIEKLGATRVCLVIDEAHHLGPKTLNLVKSLINQTPGEIVLLAMGTLWNRLETQAYAEARQLTHNRLSERIRFDGVEQVDVEKILERRLGLQGGDAKAAAQALRPLAANNGYLKFIRHVCRKAMKISGKSAVTLEMVQRAAAQVVGTR
jgi:type II secretory pathway predicted ATPase ExeA